MKEFNIELNGIEPTFIPLEFHQLEKIHIHGASSIPFEGKWIEFIGKQQNLRILIIYALLDLHHLALIIETIPEWEVIKIYWNRDYGYNEIAELMAAKTKLKKVVLFLVREGVCNEIKRITESQWQYEEKEHRSGYI